MRQVSQISRIASQDTKIGLKTKTLARGWISAKISCGSRDRYILDLDNCLHYLIGACGA